MALQQHDLKPEDVQWTLLAFKDQPQALAQGQVDVIGLMEPYNQLAKNMYPGQFRLLFDASQVFGEKQFSIHFVNSVWAKYNPQAAQGFVEGVVDSIAWIETHQDEARPIIAKYVGIKPEDVADYHFQKNGIVVMDDVAYWLDYLKKDGLKNDWLKPEDCATNEYNTAYSH
jgi:ABC-type nitrate/sulfonate/bicarbonate transport system substrate-binding protein